MTIKHPFEPQLIDAIRELKSDASVSTLEDGSIVWHDDNPTNITQEQIDTKLAELKVEYDAKDYARNREREYPSIGDQLDMQYHELETSGSLTTSGSWFNTVKAVKDANPKPEEDN